MKKRMIWARKLMFVFLLKPTRRSVDKKPFKHSPAEPMISLRFWRSFKTMNLQTQTSNGEICPSKWIHHQRLVELRAALIGWLSEKRLVWCCAFRGKFMHEANEELCSRATKLVGKMKTFVISPKSQQWLPVVVAVAVVVLVVLE